MSTVTDCKSKHRATPLTPDQLQEARRLADEAAAGRMSVSAAVREFVARCGRPIRRDTLMRQSSGGDASSAGEQARRAILLAIGNRDAVAPPMPHGAVAALAALDADEVDAIDDVPDKPDGSPGCRGRMANDPAPSALPRRTFVLATLRERNRPDAAPGREPVAIRPARSWPAGRKRVGEDD